MTFWDWAPSHRLPSLPFPRTLLPCTPLPRIFSSLPPSSAASASRSHRHLYLLAGDCVCVHACICVCVHAHTDTSTLSQVTHCPCAHADVLANATSLATRVQPRFCPKGARLAAFLRATFGHDLPRREGSSAGSPSPLIAVLTAGRSGIGRDVCAALRALPLRVLIYIACCEESLVADACELLTGVGGFAVADAARFDHLCATPSP